MGTPSHQALEQAAQWYALLQSEQATDTDRQRWNDWLSDSAEHRAAWAYAEQVRQRFAPLRSSPVRDVAARVHLGAAQRQGRRNSLLGLAALACVGTLGWARWRHAGVGGMVLAWQADYATPVGVVHAMPLADGSRVWLASATALDVRYDTHQRLLVLRRGEILLQTAADTAGRPLRVQTPHGVLQAVGTRFAVRLAPVQSQLAVYDGAVRIRTAASGAEATLAAGQQIRFDAGRIGEAQPADEARQAWSRGLLVAHHMPLGELVEELRRYHRGHIGLDPSLQALSVLGSFPIDDAGRTLRMLQEVLPITVAQPVPWWLSVAPAAGR